MMTAAPSQPDRIRGATGKTGRHFVEQALAAGSEVTALARDPADASAQNTQPHLVKGAISESSPVEEAITGADAVISTLGPRSNAPGYKT
jgi:putative NADH-flavin reductase